MATEITSTHEMAEAEWDGVSEPGDVQSDIVATDEAEGRGIEFHVSMRDYTLRDMEGLIIEAAAKQIVGRQNSGEVAKAIEAKCIQLVQERANAALASVTAEIIDQPLTPKFGDKEPVTMRQFLSLYGREYLTERVGPNGEISRESYHRLDTTRIEWLVSKHMQQNFKREIEKATNEAIDQVRAAIRESHKALLAAETARIRDAIAKATA